MIPFRVHFRPGISLYEQVVYAAKKAVVSGQLRAGDPFPSVRTLSKELKINPNTAHKGTQNPRLSLSRQGTQWFVVAFSAGPPSPAEVRPGTAIRVALGIQTFERGSSAVSS
jgi:DNA-binding transcriptional MocR family regulator